MKKKLTEKQKIFELKKQLEALKQSEGIATNTLTEVKNALVERLNYNHYEPIEKIVVKVINDYQKLEHTVNVQSEKIRGYEGYETAVQNLMRNENSKLWHLMRVYFNDNTLNETEVNNPKNLLSGKNNPFNTPNF